MFQTYKDRAAFLFVYISEAHPADGWQMPINEKQGIVFDQPTSHSQRRGIAEKCCAKLKLTIPCVVDTMDNKVDRLYAGWPERLYVIDRDGRIAYAGGEGPFGYKPEEVEKWLRKNLPAARPEKEAQEGP
jgi:hypothetical protein